VAARAARLCNRPRRGVRRRSPARVLVGETERRIWRRWRARCSHNDRTGGGRRSGGGRGKAVVPRVHGRRRMTTQPGPGTRREQGSRTPIQVRGSTYAAPTRDGSRRSPHSQSPSRSELGESERTAAGELTPPSMAMHKRGPPGRWAKRACRIHAKAVVAGIRWPACNGLAPGDSASARSCLPRPADQQAPELAGSVAASFREGARAPADSATPATAAERFSAAAARGGSVRGTVHASDVCLPRSSSTVYE